MRDHPLADGTQLDIESPPPSPDRGRAERTRVLYLAAQRLIDAAGQDDPEPGTMAELRQELAELVEHIEHADPAADAALDPDAAALCRRLLDPLRAEVIRGWAEAAEPPAAADMLAVLAAMEHVRRGAGPVAELSLASRLSGPEGLDLVVEVAHDLRSPLTSILFLAETLRRGQSGEVNEVQRRQLGIIYSAALGLISVASDMIELARGGTQLMEQDPSAFSVAGVLESVRDIVQPMAEEKGLPIRMLPPAADQRLGYPVALSRVLLNLTSNALKFTEQGLIEITVQEQDADRVEFAVRDTGKGVDRDAVRTLFQPFRRSRDKRRHAFSGSGLGLMISRRLVRAMGSELRLETRPDWGTRFFFELHLPPIQGP